MDERQLSELFNDAVRDAPPPTFTTSDVTARSAKLTRKRNSLVAGSALGFVLLAGGIVTGVALWPGSSPQSESGLTAAGAQDSGNDQPPSFDLSIESRQMAEAHEDASTSQPKQGGPASEEVSPRAGGTPSGCGTADRGLAAALAGELPAATSPSDVVPSPLGCPIGATSAAFGVQDGPRRGVMSIMLVPEDSQLLAMPPWADRGPAAQGAVVRTESGKQLVIAIEPVPGSAQPPLDADAIAAIARTLATRY